MKFEPALPYDALMPGYDILIRLVMPELRFKQHLIRTAAIAPGHRVLDAGCGTGTLLLLGRDAHPDATFIGIDPDRRILLRARGKSRSLKLARASATALPFTSGTFDRVFSTLTLHHLTREEKLTAMREILRVLKENGEFHLGDFGPPDTLSMRIASFLTQKIGREHTEENYRGILPSMLIETGFASVTETGRFASLFGVLRCIRAVKRNSNRADQHDDAPALHAARTAL